VAHPQFLSSEPDFASHVAMQIKNFGRNFRLLVTRGMFPSGMSVSSARMHRKQHPLRKRTTRPGRRRGDRRPLSRKAGSAKRFSTPATKIVQCTRERIVVLV
jgi:hypothetical protein